MGRTKDGGYYRKVRIIYKDDGQYQSRQTYDDLKEALWQDEKSAKKRQRVINYDTWKDEQDNPSMKDQVRQKASHMKNFMKDILRKNNTKTDSGNEIVDA